MLVMSQQVLVWAAQQGEDRAIAALSALQDLLTEAAVGQHLDMLYEGMSITEVTPQMSGDMSEKKAGAIISGALKMGGLMAGASLEVLDLLERWGRRIGGISQTANDIRDVLPRSLSGSDPAYLRATPRLISADVSARFPLSIRCEKRTIRPTPCK